MRTFEILLFLVVNRNFAFFKVSSSPILLESKRFPTFFIPVVPPHYLEPHVRYPCLISLQLKAGTRPQPIDRAIKPRQPTPQDHNFFDRALSKARDLLDPSLQFNSLTGRTWHRLSPRRPCRSQSSRWADQGDELNMKRNATI